MRNFSAFVLLIFYMTAALGIVVHVHYCGGKVASIAVFEKPAHACCSSKKASCHKEMPVEKGCCDDEVLLVQLDTWQTFSPSASFETMALAMATKRTFLAERVLPNTAQLDIQFFDLPPPKPQPLWLLNCALTYYS